MKFDRWYGYKQSKGGSFYYACAFILQSFSTYKMMTGSLLYEGTMIFFCLTKWKIWVLTAPKHHFPRLRLFVGTLLPGVALQTALVLRV